jgi:hypothetical protein
MNTSKNNKTQKDRVAEQQAAFDAKPRTEDCFAHCHMTMRQFGLWNRVWDLQKKTGWVYFDAYFIEDNFVLTSHDTIYSDCADLLALGWFELIGERKRKKDGTWESRKIRALAHREWSQKHPGKCRNVQVDQSGISNAPVRDWQRTSPGLATDQLLPDNIDVGSKPDGSSKTDERSKADADSAATALFSEDLRTSPTHNKGRQDPSSVPPVAQQQLDDTAAPEGEPAKAPTVPLALPQDGNATALSAAEEKAALYALLERVPLETAYAIHNAAGGCCTSLKFAQNILASRGGAR